MRILFVFSFLLSIHSLPGQEGGTTLEEYRYLTRGYAYQLDMGLDTKKEGYFVEELHYTSNAVRFVGLYDAADEELRAIGAILNPRSDQPVYICLPNPASDFEMLGRFHTDLAALPVEVQQSFEIAQREWLYAQINDVVVIRNQDRYAGAGSEDELTAKGMAIPEAYEIPPSLPAAPELPEANTVAASYELEGEVNVRRLKSKPELNKVAGQLGKVAIKFCIDGSGQIQSAKFTQRGSTTFEKSMIQAALRSLHSIRFSSSDQPSECGIMIYDFTASH